MRDRAGLLGLLMALALGTGAVAQSPSPTPLYAPEDLVAIMPTQVGPLTLDIQSFDGSEQVAEDPEKYGDLFLRLGKEPSDYSLATARGEAEDGSSVVYVAAFRIEGVLADDWGFDEVLTYDLDDPPPDRHVEWHDIGDRRVAVISDDASEAIWSAVYAKGEVSFFLVGGGGVTIEDVFAELPQMTDTDLCAAWNLVRANTPGGWYVGQPGYEERYRQWSVHAFDPSEEAVAGGRERQWTAVGKTEVECVQEMARC